MVAICDLKHLRNIFCEGSGLQNGGLTLLLVSLPADSDDHSVESKDTDYYLFGQEKKTILLISIRWLEGSQCPRRWLEKERRRDYAELF